MWNNILKFINDNKDVLSWLFGSGIFMAVVSGLYNLAIGIIKNRRANKIRNVDNFPFLIISPNNNVAKEILGGNDDNPLADRNIPYQKRDNTQNTTLEIENLLTANRFVLIVGKTGLGKTREAIQVVEKFNKEGWTVLYLTRDKWLAAPSKIPTGIPDRKLIFFLDDLNRKVYASRIEQSPNSLDEILQPLSIPLQKRLSETIEAFETLCGRQEIMVIATARNENYSEFKEEISEWDKLEFSKYNSWWKKFHIHKLQEPTNEAEIDLLTEVNIVAKIDINKKDIQSIASRNDGTFANIVENLRMSINQHRQLDIETFRDTLKGTWNKRYKDAVTKFHLAPYVYDAVDLAREIGIRLSFKNIFYLSKVVVANNEKKALANSIRIYKTLRYLSRKENLLQPRDGQIEAKGYRINKSDYLPYIFRTIHNQYFLENISLREAMYYFYTLLLPSKVIPKLLKGQSLSALERIILAIIDTICINNIGVAYSYFNLNTEATLLYEKSIELMRLHPANSLFYKGLVWFNLGRQYTHSRQYQKAINAFEKSKKNDSEYYFYIAFCNQYLERYLAAIEIYQQAIQLDNSNFKYWLYLGHCYREAELDEKAIAAYKKTIELNPTSAMAWNRLALAFWNIKDYENALVSCQKAIELDPKDSDNWSRLGDIYSALQRIEDTIASYQKGLEINPKDIGCLYNLGQIYRKINDQEAYNSIVKRIIEIDPNHGYGLMVLGDVYRDLDQDEKSIESYKKATEVDTQDSFYKYKLGQAYIKASKAKEAVITLELATELANNISYYWYELGRAQLLLDNYEKALESLSTAIKINDGFAQAYARRGYVYENLNNLIEAMNDYNIALKLQEDFAGVYFYRGLLHKQKGEKELAIADFQKAIEVSDSPDLTESANEELNKLKD